MLVPSFLGYDSYSIINGNIHSQPHSLKFAQERSSEPGGGRFFSFPELVATGGFPAINDEGFGDVTLGLASRE